jgi:hypothetical protein
MTRQEYKALRIHWPVIESRLRPSDLRAQWFGVFDMIGRERRRNGSSSVYHTFLACLREIGARAVT